MDDHKVSYKDQVLVTDALNAISLSFYRSKHDFLGMDNKVKDKKVYESY